jgi:hypothetical protein
MLSWRQVGRPWLHWSERSVASIWRKRAFISSRLRRRLARTAPWQAMVAAVRCGRAGSRCWPRAGPARPARCGPVQWRCLAPAWWAPRARPVFWAEKGVISSPRVCSVVMCASAVATSSAVAAKVRGISRGWLGLGKWLAPLPWAAISWRKRFSGARTKCVRGRRACPQSPNPARFPPGYRCPAAGPVRAPKAIHRVVRPCRALCVSAQCLGLVAACFATEPPNRSL